MKHKQIPYSNHSSVNVPDQNDLEPLYFNFALYHAIRKVQENQMELKFGGTHRVLAYPDDLNLLGNNINTINTTNKL
jgi:hypothetical protein